MAPALLKRKAVLPSRPLPIAIFLTSFDVGGTERQMVELIRRLDPVEFDVHVGCFHRRGGLTRLVEERAASIAEFPIEGFGHVATIRQLNSFAAWCRHLNCRVVQTSDVYSNVFALPGAALARVPVRIGSRREVVTPDRTAAQLTAQRVAYQAAHAIVANSTAAVDQLKRERVPSRKIHTIRNGVDEKIFTMRPRAIGPLRRIITVANLRIEKGHDTLLDAARRIVREQPDVEFLLVGDGPLRRTLEERVRRDDLTRHVRFLGERTDVASLLHAADVFVLPSRSEACPNGVLEAMATGLPVVAARVGGLPEMIESGLSGVLVPPDHPEALAAVVLDLIRRPSFALKLGRAARVEIENRFSLERMVSAFTTLYRSELSRRTSHAVSYRELAAS